jgi:thiol-disulfide isomerase/thioredoxin
MKKLKYIGVLIFLIPALALAQYAVKGTFSPPEAFNFALLYKVTPDNAVYIKNSEVNKDGTILLEMDSTLNAGIYRIVYGMPQEENNFDIIYNAQEDIEFNFNTETGIEFMTSNENSLLGSYTRSMSLVSQSIGNFYNQQSADSLALAAIFNTQRETQSSYEALAEGTIALNFIKANRPYIPERFEDIKTYINNLKAHFFDHVDFSNEVLQSSNFLIDRILDYVFGLTSEKSEHAQTYKQNIDEVVIAMNGVDDSIKKRLLEVLWQQMTDTDMDQVANYITDSYLLALSESLNDEEAVSRLNLFKSLSIGALAPEILWETEKNGQKKAMSLSTLEAAKNYLILFWSSTCHHCMEEIPQLKSFLDSQEECDLIILAIGLEHYSPIWKREILNYPDFIHVLGLGKWQNEIGRSYNITTTPTYFVLDANKKIIAKPADLEALKKVLSEFN